MARTYLVASMFLSGYIAVVVGQDNTNRVLLAPGENVKQILRGITQNCDDCSDSYKEVFFQTSFNAICGAYFRFNECIHWHCRGNQENTFLEANTLCNSSRTNIQNVVSNAHRSCGYCENQYLRVMHRTTLGDICSAFLNYKECIQTNCSTVSVDESLLDAVSICESPVNRIKKLSFKTCVDCNFDAWKKKNISSHCNKFFQYKSCISKTYCSNITSSTDFIEANFICVESQKPIKALVEEVHEKCDFCSPQYSDVQSTYSTDVCERFFAYKDCILDHCYIFYKTQYFGTVEPLCVQSTHVRGQSKLEDRIKQIVGELDVGCSTCPNQYETVFSAFKQDSVCSAYLNYKGCFLTKCYAYSSSQAIQEADSLCDGCTRNHVSVVVLVLTAILSINKHM